MLKAIAYVLSARLLTLGGIISMLIALGFIALGFWVASWLGWALLVLEVFGLLADIGLVAALTDEEGSLSC